MNIQSLIEKIDLFKEVVEESGFKRDVSEFLSALANAETQTNLVALREIAQKVDDALEKVSESDLKEANDILRPKESSFTDENFREELDTILNDPEIDTSTFHSKLDTILTKLDKQLKSDSESVRELEEVLRVYVPEEPEVVTDTEKATLALVLKDKETITGLKSFARTVDNWNRTLLIYHQLVSGKSPEDIELLEVQNGSIEIVFNLDLNVGLDLTAVIKTGLQVFGAYLAYKATVRDIVASYNGNKKLIDGEKQREGDLLDNVKQSIKGKLREQHRERKKTDNAINNEAIPKKIDEVSNVLTNQIIKGNEIKLLTAAPTDDETITDEFQESRARELRNMNSNVRKLRKQLSQNDVKLLTTKFKLSEE